MTNHPQNPSRRTALSGFGLASLTAGLAVPAVATPDADAELIATCNRLLAAEDEVTMLLAAQVTLEDESRDAPRIATLYAKQNLEFGRICRPCTMAGAAAIARAAVSMSPPDENLALRLAMFLAEGDVA
jgi:hypothetical protein